ncbi:MAG: pseudouridine-5'-phosphate glycosidase [Chloroflexota bacterium]
MIQLGREVADAVAAGLPVVALETSIVAQGLPAPHNLRAAFGCEDAIRAAGAVPATIAVLGGRLKVGLERDELELLAADPSAIKVSARDLGAAVVGERAGATTVAASVRAAHLAGIRFFATGGIGGVHRGQADDVSADLEEIARAPVAVFCAGAKMILDLPRTVERLETLGVPVIGYGTTEFPAFYTAASGLPVSARADSPSEVAAILRATWALGSRGAVVAIPPPRELRGAEGIVAQAVAEVGQGGGPALTPRLLARIVELSGGQSVEVNVELVVNNARVAGQCAAAFAT